MSSESQPAFESNRHTAEGVIDNLNKAPETILSVIEAEANRIGIHNFVEDLSYCFSEMDAVEERELAKEVYSLLGDMIQIYKSEALPDHVNTRAKMKPMAKTIVSLVGERMMA